MTSLLTLSLSKAHAGTRTHRRVQRLVDGDGQRVCDPVPVCAVQLVLGVPCADVEEGALVVVPYTGLVDAQGGSQDGDAQRGAEYAHTEEVYHHARSRHYRAPASQPLLCKPPVPFAAVMQRCLALGGCCVTTTTLGWRISLGYLITPPKETHPDPGGPRPAPLEWILPCFKSGAKSGLICGKKG